MNRSWNTLLILLATFTFTALGCRVLPRSEAELPRNPAPAMVEAQDWYEVLFTTLGSEITLQSTGHFYVDPNSCYRRESGVLTLELWNRLATTMNRVRQSVRETEEKCFSTPQGAPSILNGVKVKLLEGTESTWITSLSLGRGGKLCSYLSDQTSLAELAKILGEITAIVRREGC